MNDADAEAALGRGQLDLTPSVPAVVVGVVAVVVVAFGGAAVVVENGGGRRPSTTRGVRDHSRQAGNHGSMRSATRARLHEGWNWEQQMPA